MNMKKISKTLLSSILLMLLIFSCKNDDDSIDQITTVEEDQQNIRNSISQFYDCLQSMEDGSLSQFILNTLFDSSQEFDDSYIDTLFEAFENQYGAFLINDRFQFSNRKGVYTWNQSTSLWDVSSGSETIVIEFPSTATTSTNDVEIVFNSYSDTEASFDSDVLWLPTQINVSMLHNNIQLVAITADNITFDTSDNFSMPTNADISIYTAPFTHTISWSRNTPTEFKFEYDFQNGSNCITQISAIIYTQDSNYGNITSLEDDVKQFSGYVLHNDFKILFTANIESLGNLDDATDTDINTFVDAEVYYLDVKIGDLIYNDDEVLIVFKDGTEEDVDNYVGDFVNELELIFTEYIN